jgi:hypothetical protein
MMLRNHQVLTKVNDLLHNQLIQLVKMLDMLNVGNLYVPTFRRRF